MYNKKIKQNNIFYIVHKSEILIAVKFCLFNILLLCKRNCSYNNDHVSVKSHSGSNDHVSVKSHSIQSSLTPG